MIISGVDFWSNPAN